VTLRRKGTRTIVIDEVTYRWTVSPDDEPGLAIVVEHAASPAQKLVHWVDHGVVITPKLVRATIVDALRAGWAPTQRGPDLVRRTPIVSAV
jgi:hypothetical protein